MSWIPGSPVPELSLRHLFHRVELVLTEFCRADEAVPLDQPGGVVGFAEFEQRLTEFLDRFEVPTHSRFSFSVRMNRSAQPLPSGARTKAGELSMPRNAISFWKWSDMYCEPWS